MTTRVEPEDHLWSADDSLRNADIEDFGAETLRKESLGRHRRGWENNIKTHLK